jgi:hypothetical protein
MTRHARPKNRGVALQDPLVCMTRHPAIAGGGVARHAHTGYWRPRRAVATTYELVTRNALGSSLAAS